MNNRYEFLMEKEEIWAKILVQVLEENGIPAVTSAVYGAGLVIRTGMQERLQIFVPKEQLQKAAELADELFSEAEFAEEADED